jgi:predicted DNA-binding protein
MADMSNKGRKLSDKEIDEKVMAQADDDSAWEEPVRVRKSKAVAVPLPSELAERAAFFARLHRVTSVEAWVKRIIEERIEIEEAAFAESKRNFTKHRSTQGNRRKFMQALSKVPDAEPDERDRIE